MAKKTRRGLIIYPHGQCVAADVDMATLDALYEIIGTRVVQCVAVLNSRMMLWVDEEGLLRNPNQPNPLASQLALMPLVGVAVLLTS